MNQSRAALASLRVANRFLSTRLSSTWRSRTQVTFFPRPSLYGTEQVSNKSDTSLASSFQLNRCFSSKPSSIVQLLLANEWSDELEDELEKSSSEMNHETVVYVLRKLDDNPERAYCFFNWVCEKTEFRPSTSVYSLLLRVLVQKQSMKPFWVTLRKMKEQGFYLDEETYSTIMAILKKEKITSDSVALNHFYNRMLKENAMDNVAKKVVDIVLDREWSSDTEKKMEDMKITLSDNFVIRVLKELRNYPLKALQFFHWVGWCPGYEHNTVTYNAIARVLARQDSIEEFWSIVGEMKDAGHKMDLDTYIKISRQFQKWKMINDAVKLYEFMMEGPYKPSLQDCTLLLRSISVDRNPDLDLVFRVAKKYEATGNSLSKAVYDGMHRSLTSVGNFDEADKIINVMRNAGYEPDNITYSQLVFGLCKAKRFEEARQVLDDMEAKGCVPDIKTWTILIQGHCNANEVDKALMCFTKMMEKGINPDADVLDVLVNGFLTQKKVNGAYKLLVEMVNQIHLKPWQATYKNLIEKLLEVRKSEEAINLLTMMKKQNYPPHAEPFDQYLAKCGTVGDTMEFFKALSLKGYPSFSAYFNVFEAFFKEGRYSEANDILYKCPHHIRKHPKISELFGSAKSESHIV